MDVRDLQMSVHGWVLDQVRKVPAQRTSKKLGELRPHEPLNVGGPHLHKWKLLGVSTCPGGGGWTIVASVADTQKIVSAPKI